ncbi:MAG TPA: hypothetical protein VGX03_05775 [Candidatus Binatia bacterium]|nr:hypothetical protein [Candidatus Binatia bacterium]
MDSRFRGNDGNRAGSHWARQNEQIDDAARLDAARLRRTFGGQVAANLKELGYGG